MSKVGKVGDRSVKSVKKCSSKFTKRKNALVHPTNQNPKDASFTIMNDKEKQQILRSWNQQMFDIFALKMTATIQQWFKTLAASFILVNKAVNLCHQKQEISQSPESSQYNLEGACTLTSNSTPSQECVECLSQKRLTTNCIVTMRFLPAWVLIQIQIHPSFWHQFQTNPY